MTSPRNPESAPDTDKSRTDGDPEGTGACDTPRRSRQRFMGRLALRAWVLPLVVAAAVVHAQDPAAQDPAAQDPANQQRSDDDPANRRVAKAAPLRLPAEILARYDVDVPAEIAGKVVRRPDDDTRAVAAGEIVVTLDDSIQVAIVRGAEAAFERAVIRLKWAQRELERSTKLRESGTLGLAAHDRAETDLREAGAAQRTTEATLAEARERLERTRIKAPFAGRLVRVVPERGEYIREGATAFRLVDDTSVRIVAYVPARLVGRLRVGQEVRVGAGYDDGSLGRAYPARLFAIAPAAEGRSRTFRIEARLKRPKDMRPGMAGYLELKPTDGDASGTAKAAEGANGAKRSGGPGKNR